MSHVPSLVESERSAAARPARREGGEDDRMTDGASLVRLLVRERDSRRAARAANLAPLDGRPAASPRRARLTPGDTASVKLRKVGGSTGAYFSAALLAHLNAKVGDVLEVRCTEDGLVVMRPERADRRQSRSAAVTALSPAP